MSFIWTPKQEFLETMHSKPLLQRSDRIIVLHNKGIELYNINSDQLKILNIFSTKYDCPQSFQSHQPSLLGYGNKIYIYIYEKKQNYQHNQRSLEKD